jgi:quercetin dioxygenase-like cupin family protein
LYSNAGGESRRHHQEKTKVSDQKKPARALWYLGNYIRIHADSADTNGQFAMVEVIGRPGGEPPLHYHENEDEMFLVLEGEMTLTRGDEQILLRAGDSAFVPRLVPHTFRNETPVVRTIGVVTPAGFEDFFRAMGEPAEDDSQAPASPFPSFQRIGETAARFGSRIVR